ncbi:MarR family winged helix-turn-helix transcriptional regulator [bacterium]|nr:MarR family winged helix-turn-helix transcriptional regulator [bacterium]
MARKKPQDELLGKARVVQVSTQRIRTFLLRGSHMDRAWKGLPKEPTFGQIRAMLALHTVGPCTLKVFAEAIGVSGPTASEKVERLVEKGLVKRWRNPDNRREVLIELGDEGRKRIAEHEKIVLGHICQLLEAIGPEDANLMVELTERIAAAIDRLPSRGGKKA